MSKDGMSGDRMGDDRLRALIEGERQALAPSARAQEATWSRVAASVATPALMPVGSTGSGSGTAAATASVAPWAKVVLALSLGGGGLAYTIGTQEPAQTIGGASRASASAPHPDRVSKLARDSEPTGARTGSTTAEVPSTSVGSTVQLVPHSPTKPMALRLPSPLGAGGSAPRPGTGSSRPADAGLRAPVDAVPGVAPGPADSDPGSALAEEARLLGRARRALGAGEHAEGLAQLASHEARFPDGQLTEDRLALRARILCESGDRSSGLRAADVLAKAFPGSSHSARVGRLCGASMAR